MEPANVPTPTLAEQRGSAPTHPVNIIPSSLSTKVKPTHIARKAIVYIRQSTAQQVLNNRESTARQYALDQRALQLGWTAEQVVIVDEDQGLSGQTAEGRAGFAYLLSQVALNQVGIILGLET